MSKNPGEIDAEKMIEANNASIGFVPSDVPTTAGSRVNERLVEAIRPFAKFAKTVDTTDDGLGPVEEDAAVEIYLGSRFCTLFSWATFRRAAEALSLAGLSQANTAFPPQEPYSDQILRNMLAEEIEEENGPEEYLSQLRNPWLDTDELSPEMRTAIAAMRRVQQPEKEKS